MDTTTRTRVADVYEALVGTKRERCGPRPRGQNADHLAGVLARCIASGRPVHLLSGWGGHKGYCQGPYKAPDMLEVLAFRRFAGLRDAVRGVYPPGLAITLFCEDFARRECFGSDGGPYIDRLADLAGDMRLDDLRVVRESNYVGRPAEYAAAIIRNASLIYRGREAEAGWRGVIDWDYYLRRSDAEFPDEDDKGRRRIVSIFLGSVLARARAGLLPAHDVRCSFVPYPRHVPEAMRRGRVEYKLKDGKDNHSSPAPWACFSVVDADGIRHASLRDLRRDAYAVDVVAGEFGVPTLRRAGS